MKETLKNMYTVAWCETKAKKPPPTESKREYCERWCDAHADEIYMSLGDASDQIMFISEFFFSPSTANDAVPKLQQVFQADAAHTAFGTNGTMFPVALGMVFGNENKAAWMNFCKFIVEQHPSINTADVTIITDQCKGSIAAIKKYIPNAGQFHCSYHRAANIILNCRGGKSKESPHWLYRTLVNCGSMGTLNKIRDKYGPKLSTTQVRYLNDIVDKRQYPAARCAMGHNVYLYDHEASSGVESMNQANKKARERAAVDVVNTIMLLLEMERYVLVCDTGIGPNTNTLSVFHF